MTNEHIDCLNCGGYAIALYNHEFCSDACAEEYSEERPIGGEIEAYDIAVENNLTHNND